MGAQTEESTAAKTLACQIAATHVTAADAVVLIDAITAALTSHNGHLDLHRGAVREIDAAANWIRDELAELDAMNEPLPEAA